MDVVVKSFASHARSLPSRRGDFSGFFDIKYKETRAATSAGDIEI